MQGLMFYMEKEPTYVKHTISQVNKVLLIRCLVAVYKNNMNFPIFPLLFITPPFPPLLSSKVRPALAGFGVSLPRMEPCKIVLSKSAWS
jgi:hypothetical protein